MILMRFATRISKPLWSAVNSRCCNVGHILNCANRTIYTGRHHLRLGENPDLPDPQDIAQLTPLLGKWYELQNVRYRTFLQRAGMLSAMAIDRDEVGAWMSFSKENGTWTCKIGQNEVDQTEEYTFKLNKFRMVETHGGLPKKIVYTQDGDRLVETQETFGDPDHVTVITREANQGHMTAIYLKSDLVSNVKTYTREPKTKK